MAELQKIARVLKKLDADAPHAALLVLDATTGQNAISQVEAFQAAVPLTGLVMTKLDGTAKGGILVALADRFALPIHFIGVGESIDDLQVFDARVRTSAHGRVANTRRQRVQQWSITQHCDDWIWKRPRRVETTRRGLMFSTMSPLLKMALDLGPLLIFFAANAVSGIFTATAVFMVAITASIAIIRS